VYKWTILAGVVFLAALLWSVTFSDKSSDLIVFLFSLCFLVSLIASVVLAATRRSKVALYRVLLNIIFCLLLFPIIKLGGFFCDRLFLTRLSKFQEVTNLLVQENANGHAFSAVVSLPVGYSVLHVADRVLIASTEGNITVRYALPNSNALSHRGYMYRSDDDPIALSKEYPRTGYTRVAPHWFFFSEWPR
jgi:hypothetical protein